MQQEKMHSFIFNTINILVIKKVPLYSMVRETFLVPNMSLSLQTTLAAEAHLSEGQFLL
jgi:hypothetical protein